MSDLESRFDAAAARAQSLPKRPDNDVLLKLYALFKQGKEGDVSGKRPGITSFVARAKFDAWAGLKGTSKTDAMTQYVQLIERLEKG